MTVEAERRYQTDAEFQHQVDAIVQQIEHERGLSRQTRALVRMVVCCTLSAVGV